VNLHIAHMDTRHIGSTLTEERHGAILPFGLPLPPRVELPFDISSMKVPSDQSQLFCIYRHLEGQERRLMDWFVGAYATWQAAMKEKIRQMKLNPPPPGKHGEAKKLYYPSSYNPMRFKPVNSKGNHECTLMVQPKLKGKCHDIPITWQLFRSNRARIEKVLKFAPELKAIVLALDDACIPIRKTDRWLRKLRHGELMLSKYWREYNGGSTPTRSSRTEQSHEASSVVQLVSNVEAASQLAPTEKKRERRLSRQREF